ncbi:MAG: DUF3489 domain-containing protein [Pseudomonadota bacterium]
MTLELPRAPEFHQGLPRETHPVTNIKRTNNYIKSSPAGRLPGVDCWTSLRIGASVSASPVPPGSPRCRGRQSAIPVRARRHIMRTPGKKTKSAALKRLLQAEEGATMAQLCAALGWQRHSVRAAISGLRRSGLTIERSGSGAAGGASTYRLTGGASAK